jgi:hypothetical protein
MLQLESPVQRIRFVKELRYDPEACNRSVPTLERCLACEAEGVATRGALPRLRGRGEQGKIVTYAQLSQRSTSRLSAFTQERSESMHLFYAQLCSPRPRNLSRRRLGEGGSEATLQRRCPQPSLSRVRQTHYVLPAHTSRGIPWPANTRSTASTTSETEIRFIQRKSIGHSRRKQGLHST